MDGIIPQAMVSGEMVVVIAIRFSTRSKTITQSSPVRRPLPGYNLWTILFTVKFKGPDTKKPETPIQRDRFQSLSMRKKIQKYNETFGETKYWPRRSPTNSVQPNTQDEDNIGNPTLMRREGVRTAITFINKLIIDLVLSSAKKDMRILHRRTQTASMIIKNYYT